MARKAKTKEKPQSFLNELRGSIKAHRLPIFAAAVAFFGFIALIPALAAGVSITGLVADTDQLVQEAESALENSPEATQEFIVSQIKDIADGSDSSAGIAAAIGVSLAIFSASGAIGQLMEALNVVFDRTESRNFVLKRLMAIGLLLGTILTLAAMVFAMSVVPALIEEFIDAAWLRALIGIGRFVLLALFMIVALTVLYKVGPASDGERERELVPGGVGRLITPGAIVGMVLLVLLSWGFGFFVDNFGSYGETYGTLATIVVVLLWLQLMALAVLIGAEVDAVTQRRAVREARTGAGLAPEVPTT